MNILYIGKYPPVEGGTSSASYWRIEALRKYSILFDVITCISKDSDYYIPEYTAPENVHVIQEKISWHIPYSQLYSERLISKSLEMSERKNYDAVEGCYFFPYGFSAYVVSEILHKPLILRHAGSDLYRLAGKCNLDSLLVKMLQRASKVVTYRNCIDKLRQYRDDSELYISDRYVPDPIFSSVNGSHIYAAFLGKISDKWNRAQLDYYLEFLLGNNYHGCINVYSNEYTVSVFKKFFDEKGFPVRGKNFVRPSKVPEILSETKYLLVSDIPEGIPEESNIFAEGLAAGCIAVTRSGRRNIMCFSRDFHSYIRNQAEIYMKI